MPHNAEPGGFREAAKYFEARARRARDETNHERHLNTARYYRDLAAITPGLPAGYVPPRHVTRAKRYRNRAEECRSIAVLLVDPDCKQQMADLAATYDNLAATCEKLGDEVLIQPSDAMRRDSARPDGESEGLPR